MMSCLPEVVNGVPRLEYYREYNKTRRKRRCDTRTHEQRAAEYAKARHKQLAQKKLAYALSPDRFKEAARIRRMKRTPDEIAADCAYQVQYRKTHIVELSNKQREKVANNLDLQVLRTLRSRINSAIARAKKERDFVKKCANTATLIGCTVDELIRHLEGKWLPGMSWDNHGVWGWHIDHILPCAAFDMAVPEQQRACFHYTNLQPLWGTDNIKKGAKIL